MNKVIVSTLIACGLLILEIPEAAAHPPSHTVHRSPAHYQSDSYYRDYRHPTYTRASGMPRWLKQDRSFRHWYKHSRLQRNPYLSWHELFDIYHWERSRHSHRSSRSRSHYRH